MSVEKPNPASPKWGSTFKMVIGLIVAGLIIAMLIYFRSIIGPLILAFILVYLLHPVAALLDTHTQALVACIGKYNLCDPAGPLDWCVYIDRTRCYTTNSEFD